MGRPFTLALAVSFLLPLGGAPETLRYRIEQSFEQKIDLSSMGQGEQNVAASSSIYLTVQVDDSAGGKAVTATVDSLVFGPGANPAVVQQMGAINGATGSGFIAADGEVIGFAPADSMAPSVKGFVQSVFPKLSRKPAAGDSWSDTTSATDSTGGQVITRSVVTNYSAAAGQGGAVALSTTGSYSMSGIVNNGMTLDGTGRSTGRYELMPRGFIRSGTFADTADMAVVPPMANDVIPIVNAQNTVITLLQ